MKIHPVIKASAIVFTMLLIVFVLFKLAGDLNVSWPWIILPPLCSHAVIMLLVYIEKRWG